MFKSMIGMACGFGVSVALCSAAGAAAPVRYVCADKTDLSATFEQSPGAAVLKFDDGKELTLPQVLSADGGRYAAGDTEFWIKGREATLTRGQSKTTCKS